MTDTTLGGSAPCQDPFDWAKPAVAPPHRPYVLLDDNTGSGAPSALYTEPQEIVRADTAQEVPAALSRLEAAAARGLHAAGFFAYELGYVLEPRLAHLMPPRVGDPAPFGGAAQRQVTSRTVPLIWFGLFPAPRTLSSSA